jgi:chromosome segregation ATPase
MIILVLILLLIIAFLSYELRDAYKLNKVNCQIIDSLRYSVDDKEKTIRQSSLFYEETIASLRQNIASANQQYASHIAKKDELLEYNNDKIMQLEVKLANIKMERTKLSNELNAKIKQYETRDKMLTDLIGKKEKQIDDLLVRIDELKNDLNEFVIKR